MRDELEQATAAVRAHWRQRPRAGIVLGTGLGSFAQQIQLEARIDYAQIPHFPRATALGHAGRLLCGTVAGLPIVTMEGRLHPYEGYSLDEITLPIRVMRQLGAEWLILSNASGGLNPQFASGDVVVIRDHINLLGCAPHVDSPPALERASVIPHVSPYDRELSERALAIARRQGFTAHNGVYAAVLGPNYETRAEYRMLRHIGADVVGMSTVPEVLVAAEVGLRVVALSVVTNVCRPDELRTTSGTEVISAAESTEPKMRAIVCGLLSQLVTS